MNVLLAVDHSHHSVAAARFLQRFGFPPRTRLHLLYVVPPPEIPPSALVVPPRDLEQRLKSARKTLIRHAHQFLDRVAGHFKHLALKPDRIVVEGMPAQEILKATARHDIDLVVLGTRGLSGVKRFMLGSVTEQVLNNATCSVLAVHELPKGKKPPKSAGVRLLFAIDRSPYVRTKAAFLKRLGLPRSSRITVLHVVEPIPHLVISPEATQLANQIRQAYRRSAEKILTRTKRQLTQKGVTVETRLLEGNPAAEIVEAAKRASADLIVLGSQYLIHFRRRLFPSVSHKVAHHTPCSLLIVRKS